MQVSDYVRSKIERLPKGFVFTYGDFGGEVNKREAIIKALNRMVDSGEIAKLSKGRYFKPEKTPFGILQPSQEQIVKDLLHENGKVVGYLTGYSMYNTLGLTTQISNVIQIGKNQTRPKFKRERYTISFVKQKNTITRNSIPLLQILDSIKYIKKIPDTTIKISCLRFIEIFKGMNLQNWEELIRLSLKYPPSTRALLGAMIDEIETNPITHVLKESLNPITKYKIPGASTVLSKSVNWNII